MRSSLALDLNFLDVIGHMLTECTSEEVLTAACTTLGRLCFDGKHTLFLCYHTNKQTKTTTNRRGRSVFPVMTINAVHETSLFT